MKSPEVQSCSVSEARSSNRRFPFPLAKHPLGSPCRRSDTPFTVQLEQALRGNSADAAASLLAVYRRKALASILALPN